jgi:hypothetical protein
VASKKRRSEHHLYRIGEGGVSDVARTLKIVSRPWGGMPMPVSATLTVTSSGSAELEEADTVTQPSAGVNLMALLYR